MHRRYVSALFGLVAIAAPSIVAAQSNVVIMKVESSDADPAVVDALTQSLLTSVQDHPDYNDASLGEMTIGELTVTAGCSRPDEACMKQLADFIPGDALIFARVTRQEDGHTFSLRMFNFKTGEFLNSIDEAPASAENSLNVTPMIADWLVYGPVGELEVSVAGQDGLPVLFNGRALGEAPGVFTELPLGEHTVAVRGPDGVQSTTVILQRDQRATASFAFDIAAPSKVASDRGEGPSAVPGIALLGVGAAGIVLGVVSSLQVDAANTDTERLMNGGYLRGDNAFVDEAAVQRARNDGLDPQKIRSRGETFEVLQYVGYGVGAVAIGAGTYFLVRAATGRSKSETVQFDVAPSHDGVAASITARF